MVIFLTLSVCIIGMQVPTPLPIKNVDPIVHRELLEITTAFRNVRRIEIETTYHASEKRYLPINSMHVYYDRPNRLSLEVYQPSIKDSEQDLSKVVCDGKEVFAYQQARGVFTREKVSRDPNKFQMFSASIEMAAMTGLDPFTALEQGARSATLKEGPFLDGMTTNEITFDMSDAKSMGSITIYSGKKDHLVRKLAYESRPIPKVVPEEVKNEYLTEPPPPSAPEEKPISFSYENRIVTDRAFGKEVFVWTAPPGAFQYQDYPSIFNPGLGADKSKSKKAKKGTLANGMPAMRIYTIEELMKRAKDY